MSHFYDSSGKLHTKVTNQAAVKRGDSDTQRDANLKDARKNGWLPGWTAIGGILDKPSLNKWKAAQLREAVDRHLTQEESETTKEYCYRLLEETREEFWRRVGADYRQETDKYRELGTEVHWQIADFLGGQLPIPENPVVKRCLQGFIEWHDDHVAEVIASEQTFCSPEWGYGGTIDLQYTDQQGRYCIVDFKTKRTKPKEKIVQYNENKRQLVAYALGIGKINVYTKFGEFEPDTNPANYPILSNLFLSTTELGRWEYIEVDPKEIPNLILDVRDLARIWARENKFNVKGDL